MKYALRNLVRMPARTALMFLLLFFVLLLTMFGQFMITLCEEVKARSNGPLDGTVIVTDKDGYAAMYYTVARDISGNCDAIEHIYAVSEKQVWFEDLDYIGEPALFDMKGETDCTQGFMLSSVTSMDICRETYSGEIEMVSGTPITEEDNEKRILKCVVSDALAEKNGLSLGSTVTLSLISIFTKETDAYGLAGSTSLFAKTNGLDRSRDEGKIGEETYRLKFTVGGIYHNNVKNTSTAPVPYLDNDNRIYVPITVVSDALDDLRNCDQAAVVFSVTGQANTRPTVSTKDFMLGVTTLNYRLKDLSYADGVEKMLNGLGLREEMMLTPFVADAANSPAAALMLIINWCMVGVIGAGSIELFIILIFNMIARKRELSVLAALGKSRMKISLSFFAEIFVVFVVALLICALVFGLAVKTAAKPISEYLEESESSVRYENRSAADVITDNEAAEKREAQLLDFNYLFSEYIATQSLLTALLGSAVIVMAFVIITVLVSKTEVLTSLTGKQ